MPNKYIISKNSGVDIKAVSRAWDQIEVEDIFLIEAKITSDPSTRSPKRAHLEYKFDTNTLKKSEDGFSIICNFVVSAIHKDSPENLLMTINAKFVIVYSLQNPEKLKPKDIDNFIKLGPIDTAWPYWREFVQNLTSRMGFPALTIPILKFDVEKSNGEPFSSDSPKKRKAQAK